MTGERWSYQVFEVKPGFLGLPHDKVRERLNELGRQGRELVSAVQGQWWSPVQFFLKKAMP